MAVSNVEITIYPVAAQVPVPDSAWKWLLLCPDSFLPLGLRGRLLAGVEWISGEEKSSPNSVNFLAVLLLLKSKDASGQCINFFHIIDGAEGETRREGLFMMRKLG